MKSSKIISTLVEALPTSLTMLVLSFVFASLLGLLLTWLYLKDSPIPTGIAKIYLGIVRGTPPLLMLLVAYYGLPKLFGLIHININDWGKMFFGVAGLSIGWAAYLEEAFRSAYLSVDKGQTEAAFAVGMDARHVLIRIALPQAFLIALPNIENLVIGLLKATSLVYVIGMVDMYSKATDLANQNQGVYQLKIFVILALIYWVIVLIIEWLFRLLRRHYRYVIA